MGVPVPRHRPGEQQRSAAIVLTYVHPWTLRKENAFLPPALRKGSGAAAQGDLGTLARMVRASGADGVFTDDPALVLSALGR